eukprot:CAMPEP_0168546388 /NCGR_PEP_ID=MMETSP0413-20121227/3473_1 /TAXON_ID=136452 /ORGANISM="Filamoeba nolandi, Strain NC-AS-23-1" /LENGTH=200 /DNA_ID=CAMNT_0008576565 /DNA_START=22 /DNA_END=624 /DNA_ORIENTATION=-
MTAMSLIDHSNSHPSKPNGVLAKTNQENIPLSQPQFKRPIKRHHLPPNPNHLENKHSDGLQRVLAPANTNLMTKQSSSFDQTHRSPTTLTQLRPQEQQKPPRPLPPKHEPIVVRVPSSVHPHEDKHHAHAHHDILRQHNEDYRAIQAKKSAVQMASQRHGYFAPHDSRHFNFIVPVLPSLQQLNSETTPPTLQTEHSEIS